MATPAKRSSPFNIRPHKPYKFSKMPPIKMEGVVSHALESRHGGSVYSGAYQGSFGRARPGNDANKAHYLKAGVGFRDFQRGTVSATGTNQTLWLGHASYRPYLALQAVCAAMVRKLYYKATSRDITNLNSVVLGNADAVNFAVESYDMATGRAVALVTVTAGTDTLATVAAKLTGIFIADIGNKASREYTYIYMYNGTNEGLALSLSGMTVDLYGNSHLKIQNITQEDSTADADLGNAADVHNFPLQGVMYHGRGNFTMQKSTKEVSVASGSYDAPFESHCTSGFMSPALYQNTSSGSTVTIGGSLSLPQVSEQFTDVNGSRNVKLSPGVIKADHLDYCVKQKFNTFINNLVVNPDNVDPTGTNFPYQRTHRGQFNLFALTELVHGSTTAVLKVWYELWYELYCRVSIVHEEQFMLPPPYGTTFNTILTNT